MSADSKARALALPGVEVGGQNTFSRFRAVLIVIVTAGYHHSHRTITSERELLFDISSLPRCIHRYWNETIGHRGGDWTCHSRPVLDR